MGGDEVKHPDHTVVDSERLRRLRRERGFSQLGLAIHAGVGLTTLERIEREFRPRCRNFTVARLAIALGERFENLCDASDPRFESDGKPEV
jgi:transcriptional regulator with XRE-family HTH domain